MVPQNEKKRLEALKAYQILDTENEEQFDRLTKLASLICETPIALVSLIDEQRQWFKSAVGLDVPFTAREISFCQHAIMGDELFEVESTKNDQRFVNNPLVTGFPTIQFYAGFPLKDPVGFNLGTLCVIDTKPKKLTNNQKIALELLAKEVVSQMIARINNLELLKFKKQFEFSHDLICIVGTDGYLKNINPAFVNTLGWTNEELLSKPFLEIIHPEDQEKAALEIDTFKEDQLITQFEARFLKKNGQYIWLSWIAKADLSQGEAFAIARDVTENKEHLIELTNAKNLAESANKVKEEFLSNMSHEIRTPLNAIIGFNQLLAQSELNENQKKQVDIIGIASKNLIGILNDILDTSKLESGNVKLDVSPISIKKIIKNVIKLQRPEAKAKNIKLLKTIDPDLPPYTMADENRINQILLNLINNGIKFTDKGYVEVKVLEISRKNNQSTIRFIVKDTGIGIPENKQLAIF
ncbi:MAG: Response regulator, partial [Bacteroidota bacterium]|nr:Response regulator [Bacteroidota bacterium]